MGTSVVAGSVGVTSYYTGPTNLIGKSGVGNGVVENLTAGISGGDPIAGFATAEGSPEEGGLSIRAVMVSPASGQLHLTAYGTTWTAVRGLSRANRPGSVSTKSTRSTLFSVAPAAGAFPAQQAMSASDGASLDLAAVPEPGSLVSLCGGLGVLVMGRRRRRLR